MTPDPLALPLILRWIGTPTNVEPGDAPGKGRPGLDTPSGAPTPANRGTPPAAAVIRDVTARMTGGGPRLPD